MENIVKKILSQNIKNQDCVFVFPTEISATSWAEAVMDFTDTKALAMERFIAWDAFKTDSIKSTRQNKKSIPALVRKLFVKQLISENAEKIKKGQNPVFLKLINPEYSEESSGFVDWISGFLPQLETWKKKKVKISDDEDRDYQALYERYKNFLDDNDLFEPAWEEPPFDDKGKKYFVFFPEILQDFLEYKEILCESKHIELVKCPEKDISKIKVIHYENSREELRKTALYIRKLVSDKKCNWDEIAVSIPDIERYAPYVTREFDLYEIPYAVRSGQKLNQYRPAKLFEQIQKCINEDFSFDSIKELLLNTNLPWKEKELQQKLIVFGINTHTICSFEQDGKQIDVWKKSFASSGSELLENNYYNCVKESCLAFKNKRKFTELNQAYFNFSEKLFEKTEFSDEANRVIGQCMNLLANLCDIQKDFEKLEVDDALSFFVNEIKNKDYLGQAKERGVNIFPYRVVSSAQFKNHIVLDSSQTSLSVKYEQLNFLREDKRKELKLSENNPSANFIKLYEHNSELPARFSYAEKSFSGYTVPYGELTSYTEKDSLEEIYGKAEDDFYSAEKKFILEDESVKNNLTKITQVQKNSFDIWKNFLDREKKEKDNYLLDELISEKILKSRSVYSNGKIKITTYAMKNFFECPRLWLFDKVLKINDRDLEMTEMNQTEIGIIYHEAIEKILSEYKKNNNALLSVTEFSEEEKNKIDCIIDSIVASRPLSFFDSLIIDKQKILFKERIKKFLKEFMNKYAGCTIYDLEKDIIIEEEDYILEGKIDCLLSNADGSLIIVDYKTGTPPKNAAALPDQEGNLEDFQLAMYAHLVKKSSEKFCVCECDFFNIRDAKLQYVATSEDEVNIMTEALSKYISKYYKCVKEKDFTSIKEVPYQSCRACKYRQICRRDFVISGRKI